MLWYLVMAGVFLAYQMDVIFYSLVAYLAALGEWWAPVPGHPRYDRKHPSALVYPPKSTNQGQREDNLKIARTKSGKVLDEALLAPSLEQLRPNGWSISTAAEHAVEQPYGQGNMPQYVNVRSLPAPASLPRVSASGNHTEHHTTELHSAEDLHSMDMRSTTLLLGGPAGHPSGSNMRLRSAANSETGQAGSTSPTRGSRLQLLAASNQGRQAGAPSQYLQSLHRPCLLPESLVKQYDVYPMVLVQLPMYNEEAHCELVIERACRMEWPRDRVIIQVCDDSNRDDIKRRIDSKAEEMCRRGHNVVVTRREKNVGYKAGNMLNGMAALKGCDWEYVAVFDADFEMQPDFLYQTVHHMMKDHKLAFVQTRWTFTNGYDNLLCWVQMICMNYHFAVEQRARSHLRTFFGFNGTGGIWRRVAMDEAGGWSMDSTVEDMDLSLRSYLQGWKFKYLHWVKCPNELPPTLSAYKTQQYRWNSGPMVVMKTMVTSIWTTAFVNLVDRLSATYFFFRFVYSAFLALVALLCIPIILWLDEWQWEWPQLLFLVSGNTAAVVFIWFAGLLFWPYFLLQTGLGYFRVYAMVNGLFGSQKAKTWKVTKKFGGKPGKNGKIPREIHKPYLLELVMASFYLAMTFFSVWYHLYVLAAFGFIMAVTFLAVSFGDYWI